MANLVILESPFKVPTVKAHLGSNYKVIACNGHVRDLPKSTPDAVLSALTPVQLTVLEGIPDDRAISADQLQALGCPYGDTIAALTMLEIMGLIQKLPGGLYTKS